jgi:metal-responsive CopG/Arc/MetJ family transcriptional regulator
MRGIVMARIVIDLPDEDLRLIDAIKAIQKKPRAEIIRRAISGYLTNNCIDNTEDAFGIWQQENADGLTFQTALREEWGQ